MAYPYTPRTDVYRPSYGTVSLQTRASVPPGNPLNYDNADVNRMPLNPRRRPAADPPQPPQLWDEHLDLLISRTTRAYDLVIHYNRDSNGGRRWSSEDIDYIHHVGRYLHGYVRNSEHWKEVIAKEGKKDAFTMDRIRDDVENLHKYCEQIQDVIRETERVPLRQRITRDDGVRAGEEMDEGREENEYAGGVADDLNTLGGNAVEEHGMDNEMYIDQEDKAEVIDSPIDARWATWATKPPTRFAW